MSNKGRIEQLEAWVEAIDNATTRLTTRVKALESAVTLTDMGCATAEPEPSLPSPWQPMETCPAWNGWCWYALRDGTVRKDYGTARALDFTMGRIAWCSAADHPEPPPHPDVLGKVEPSGPRPTVVDWQPIETAPIGVSVLVRESSGDLYDITYGIGTVPARTRGGHWAPLPAPPTEPGREAPDERSDEDESAANVQPSPDKAERYTAEWTWLGKHVLTFGNAQGGRLVATFEDGGEAKRIAAALNSTPDPLLVGLVDYCQAWRKAVRLHGFTYTSQASRDLIAAIDAYLAGEGER